MGTTSNHHAPYDMGYKRATMVVTKRGEPVRVSGSQKSHPSSDCGLQPAHTKLELLVIADQNAAVNTLKLELLVIADQNAAVNTFPGLVHTARHTMGVGSTRSR